MAIGNERGMCAALGRRVQAQVAPVSTTDKRARSPCTHELVRTVYKTKKNKAHLAEKEKELNGTRTRGCGVGAVGPQG